MSGLDFEGLDEYDEEFRRELSDILLSKQKHISTGLDWLQILDNCFFNTHLGTDISFLEEYQFNSDNVRI